jgi:hypothetical protein
MPVANRLALMGAGGAFPRWVPQSTILAALGLGVSKWASNPVLPKGAGGQWDDWGVRDLAVVIDANGLPVRHSDGLWGFYWGRPDSSGTPQIGLAKSTDAGASWTRYGSNPVIAPSGVGGSWYESGVATGAVILENGVYQMIATGFDPSAVTRTGVFTSTNGTSWTDQGLKLTLANFLDGATAVVEGGPMSVIKRTSGDYLALFEFRKSGVTNGWRIFGATATTFAGTWTPLNSGQPLLSPTGSGWESVGVANGRIIENVAGQYMVAYNGIGTGGDLQWRIGFAYGSDLTSLTRYASNYVLAKGASGQWDDLQTEACFLFKEPGSGGVRLLYQGYEDSDGSMQVGLATA